MRDRASTVSEVQKYVTKPSSEGTPPQYPIESVDNALKLILLLGEESEIRLTDASTHLGVASSTAHRILAMLSWRGFVRQNPSTKMYGPGPALTTVAFSVLRRMDIPRIAQPVLDDLSTLLGETSHIGTLEGSRVRFLAVSEPAAAVRVASRIGTNLPAHCTSTGKALLATLSEEQLHRLYPNEALDQVTAHSVSTRNELERQLEKVRRDGYATNREESENGVASVAVAVPSSNGATLAVNVSAPVHRLPTAKFRAFSRVLKEAVSSLSEMLG